MGFVFSPFRVLTRDKQRDCLLVRRDISQTHERSHWSSRLERPRTVRFKQYGRTQESTYLILDPTARDVVGSPGPVIPASFDPTDHELCALLPDQRGSISLLQPCRQSRCVLFANRPVYLE